ncbi:MAG: trypsin-like peptidase domain-containing protein [Thermoleophilaceae bacterium]|nr:trypsin-like peptidase domain-containing protein [Thermoleophilaceae bacterium]
MTRRRSLWIDHDERRHVDQGPFSSARWRRQAQEAEERRRPRSDPAPAEEVEPPRRRFRWLPAAGLGVALAALALALVALLGGDGEDTALLPAGGDRQLPSTPAGRVYQAAGPAVVSVQAGPAGGTGFVVRRDGTIVTNAHVVSGAETAQVRFNDTGRLVEADVLGTDPSSDLAVLRVDPGTVGSIRALPLADSDKVRVGDAVVAIGHPFGLDRTATAGIVSGVGREIRAPDGFQIEEAIQTDAPINPGNSGGPLLDARGRVVGVNAQIATAGNPGNVGIGFAVPANTLREVLPRLSRGERIVRPYLGVTTAQHPSGASIAEVIRGGPARAAGLRAGDVIVEIDGRAVDEPEDVSDAVSDRRPGDEVEVDVIRDGERQTITVELDKRPQRTP